MKKKLALIGAGHAHMTIMARLAEYRDKGWLVTAIGPQEHHYYSGMGPGMLSGVYTPDDIRFPVREMIESRGGEFIMDTAARIDPEARVIHLASGATVEYDVLSCNAGSYVPLQKDPVVESDIYPVKPIESLLAAQRRIRELTSEREIHIGVAGGGPAALEVAGNSWRLCRDIGGKGCRITVFAGRSFMARFPERIRKLARKSLEKRGITILEEGYVKDARQGEVELADGAVHAVDLIFVAPGIKPSSIFVESGLPTGPDGGLLVNEYLHSVSYPNIFGGGDCIHYQPGPLDKVGVYAVRQNPVLLHNTMAALSGGDLQKFDPGGKYLLIFNMGDDTGLLWKGPFMFMNKLAFKLKDYIDRKFMREFQP